MGKPTEVENVSLKRLLGLAERLEKGTATERDRDEALGTIVKVWCSERTMGLVSVSELETCKLEYETALLNHVENCPHARPRRKIDWPAASVIIGILISATGLILKFGGGG